MGIRQNIVVSVFNLFISEVNLEKKDASDDGT